MNPMQMIGMAFTHSTSDFGNILLDVANKSILQGWQEAPETFDAWTKKGQLSDFRIAHRVGMGDSVHCVRFVKERNTNTSPQGINRRPLRSLPMGSCSALPARPSSMMI